MPVDKQVLEAAKSAKDEAFQLFRDAMQSCEEAETEALQQLEQGAIDGESYQALVEAISEDRQLAVEQKKAAMQAFRQAIQVANARGRKKAGGEAE